MFSQRFSVEFDRRCVGVAVRVPGGFIFYSSDRNFDELDGKPFRRARAIERRLEQVAKKNGARRAAARRLAAAV